MVGWSFAFFLTTSLDCDRRWSEIYIIGGKKEFGARTGSNVGLCAVVMLDGKDLCDLPQEYDVGL